jgi:hypothetical protein
MLATGHYINMEYPGRSSKSKITKDIRVRGSRLLPISLRTLLNGLQHDHPMSSPRSSSHVLLFGKRYPVRDSLAIEFASLSVVPEGQRFAARVYRDDEATGSR